MQIERQLLRARRAWQRVRGATGQIYVEDRVEEYRALWTAATRELGASLRELDTGVWEIERDGRRTRIHNDLVQLDDPVVLEIAGNKPLVYRLLREHGLPVPDCLVFALQQLDEACGFLARHAAGCVVKPARGTSAGRGVTTHVRTGRDVRRAALLASLYDSNLLIEPMTPGESFRLLVLDGTMIHAVGRLGPRLCGDGRSTVLQLLELENDRRRLAGERMLAHDRDVDFTLAYQGLSPASVPCSGREFPIKSTSDPEHERVEVRTAYNQDVTDRVCESVRRSAAQAAQAVGARFVGVDLITLDVGQPLSESGGLFNEVNTTPSLHHHHDPAGSEGPAVAVQVLDRLLSPPNS